MSKSNWKELPDWQKPAEYQFLNNEPNTVWAWEFLRRNQLYRADWQVALTMGDAHYVYTPEKRDGETDDAWRKRVLSGGEEPRKLRFIDHAADKWGISLFADPYEPCLANLKFVGSSQRDVHPLELYGDVDQFLFLEEFDGGDILRFRNDVAVLAINLRASLEDVLTSAERILRKLRTERKEAGLLTVEGAQGPKPKTWLRALRVLDARRLASPISYSLIANTLDDYDGNKDPSEIGTRYFKAAERLSISGYGHVATCKTSPPEI